MNFSIHTFELRLEVSPVYICKIRNWLYSKHIPIIDGKCFLNILQYSDMGVRIHFYFDYRKPYLAFIVNLREVGGNRNLVDLIDPENFDSALEQANGIIYNFLEGKYDINSLKLCRIDLCVNIDVGSQEAVDTYLKLLNYKSGSRGGYKIQNINSPNGYSENEFLTENRAVGISISVYNKKAQLLDINREKEAERAEGILRVEVQLKRHKTIKNLFSAKFTNPEIIKTALLHSREIMADILAKAIPQGDYYRLADAIDLVSNNVDKEKMVMRMVRLLELTSKKHSTSLAKEALFSEDKKLSNQYYRNMLEEFGDLNLNTVTLGRKCSFDYLKGLSSFFTDLQ